MPRPCLSIVPHWLPISRKNDALMATATLKTAFRTDVEPILAKARLDKGAAIDPVATFRAAGYRERVARERPQVSGAGGGIV